MGSEKLYLGVDVGSVSANTVIMNDRQEMREDHSTRLKGRPLKAVLKILEEILRRISSEKFRTFSFTGIGGKLLAELLGGNFINEIIAQAKAVQHFYPQVRTIIDMGGEDSKLILIEEEEGHHKIGDFSMNTLCAAGTGSFLDQQASRLGLTIEDFGHLALKSTNPPRIAGRCSVFAKSDMIHLQQIATPDYDIVAGLCYALGRNFKSNNGKGKIFVKPISFQGGVAANAGMRKAFLDVLEVSEGELIVPNHFASMGAIGALLVAQKDVEGRRGWNGLSRLNQYLKDHREEKASLKPLSLSPHHLIRRGQISLPSQNPGGEKIEAYLGLDVGSISTNLVVIDKEKRVLAKRYLMTAGRPIEAVRIGLQEIGEEIGDRVEIKGVGTTGSGRYLTANL